MKKLFVSVPMKGRTEDEIRASIAKMKNIAEAYEGEPFELIDSYVADIPPVDGHQAIWYLSKSLEKLSTADVVICVDTYWQWNGCAIEFEAARRYNIRHYTVPTGVVVENYREVLQRNGEETTNVDDFADF